MRTRDFGFVALGRFLVVEQYYQSHQPSSAHPRHGSGVDRTGAHAHQPENRSSGSPAPARRHHG